MRPAPSDLSLRSRKAISTGEQPFDSRAKMNLWFSLPQFEHRIGTPRKTT